MVGDTKKKGGGTTSTSDNGQPQPIYFNQRIGFGSRNEEQFSDDGETSAFLTRQQ